MRERQFHRLHIRHSRQDRRRSFQSPLAFPSDVRLNQNPSFESPTLETRYQQALEDKQERSEEYRRK